MREYRDKECLQAQIYILYFRLMQLESSLMSCQIKDYQKAPLNLSSVVPLNAPPSAVCKAVRAMERLPGKCWERVRRRETNRWERNWIITSREREESELPRLEGEKGQRAITRLLSQQIYGLV